MSRQGETLEFQGFLGAQICLPDRLVERPQLLTEIVDALRARLQAQLADVTALRDDAAARGWHTEVARHSRVIARLQAHLQWLTRDRT